MRYGVWTKLDFVPWDERKGQDFWDTYRIGQGKAGYTMITFTDKDKADKFAADLPECSLMPCGRGAFELKER